MKKFLQLSIILSILLIHISNAFASGSFKVGIQGATTIRAGDTVSYNVTVESISGMSGGIAGIQGEISFDTKIFAYQSFSSNLPSDWQLEINSSGGRILFVAYDNTAGSKTIKGNSTIFTLTFQVLSSVNTGDKALFTIDKTAGSDGNLVGATVTGSSLNTTVAAPLSTNNFLSHLSVNADGMTPVFHKNTTSYQMTLSYNVSAVTVNATSEDAKSTVTIAGQSNLKPEQINDVKITVKAENGAVRVYTIRITRERDPEKPFSDNNNLSALTIDKGILSPVFHTNTIQYIVWLPYEVDSITVTGIASDDTADVKVDGGTGLIAGADNEILITVTAENGNEKKYTLIAKRASAHKISEESEDISSDPSSDAVSETQDLSSEPEESSSIGQSDASQEQRDDISKRQIILWPILLAAVLAGAIGFLAGAKIQIK